MLSRLRSCGVPVDGQRSSASLAGTGSATVEEAGSSEEAPMVAAVAQAMCSRLGLDIGSTGNAPKARLPPPIPGPPRIPACAITLNHVGLWERFRKICGTPLPAETPQIPCELRTSRGGGQVVVPLPSSVRVGA